MAKTNVVVKLKNGTMFQVETTAPPGGNVASLTQMSVQAFDGVRSALEGISNEVLSAMSKVKPKSAKVEFGIKVSVESGKLTGLLVQGAGEANLTVTLEWGA